MNEKINSNNYSYSDTFNPSFKNDNKKFINKETAQIINLQKFEYKVKDAHQCNCNKESNRHIIKNPYLKTNISKQNKK